MNYALLCFISLLASYYSCNEDDFVAYTKEFRQSRAKLEINDTTFLDLFLYDGEFKEIPDILVTKYIDNSRSKEKSNYRYDFGVRLEGSNMDYLAVLVRKQQYDETYGCDNDLSTLILITYSKSGDKKSMQEVGLDNDCWISSTEILDNEVVVKQIKLLEFGKDEIDCEVLTKKYRITAEGFIEFVHSEPLKNGVLIWDHQSQKFKLK